MNKSNSENKKKFNSKILIIGMAILIAIGGFYALYLIVNQKNGEISQQAKKVNIQSENKELWTCTMHPQVISDKAGQCPICGMDLVKQITDDHQNHEDNLSTIKLTSNEFVLANVSTMRIEKKEIKKQISVYSYMEIPDQNRKVIAAKFNGRIEKLYIDKTGDIIKKGQALFDVYSPDLVQAQNEYLIALNSSQNLLKYAKNKLQIYGMTAEQINELEKTKEIKMTVTFYSTFGGTVIEKKVQEGMYFNEGQSLYEVADLTTLWNIGEIYENDLNILYVGNKVNLVFQSYPDEIFVGKVSFIYPVVNPQTRTVKVRSDFSNIDGKLKPQMYALAFIERSFGDGLLVPADAILFMGKRDVVWLKVGDGMFEPRDVTVGMKIGDKYQILSGINVGDEIAMTGGFLIDSESQLKSGMATGHQHGGDNQGHSSDQENNHNHNAMENMNHKK
ncbi:MAG: efflux RND transporter periplasmic adaptor subunit [Bacteroidetes bacterium]|nr:efflux RND transporter periplasmic adaptor subunit [Bacteroidota bacterium]